MVGLTAMSPVGCNERPVNFGSLCTYGLFATRMVPVWSDKSVRSSSNSNDSERLGRRASRPVTLDLFVSEKNIRNTPSLGTAKGTLGAWTIPQFRPKALARNTPLTLAAGVQRLCVRSQAVRCWLILR